MREGNNSEKYGALETECIGQCDPSSHKQQEEMLMVLHHLLCFLQLYCSVLVIPSPLAQAIMANLEVMVLSAKAICTCSSLSGS